MTVKKTKNLKLLTDDLRLDKLKVRSTLVLTAIIWSSFRILRDSQSSGDKDQERYTSKKSQGSALTVFSKNGHCHANYP